MKSGRLLTAAVLLAGLIAPLSGCASSPALIGPRPKSDAGSGEVVRGSACGILVFGFIPAATNSRTERAYRAALAGRGGELTDTQIRYSWVAIPMVGLMLCTEIEGTVMS